MLYPDPKMRTLLGWPIRWLASVFAFVWMATGALPIEAASEPRQQIAQSASGLSASGSDTAIALADHASAIVGFLGASNGSEFEREIEEEERNESVAALFALALFDRLGSFHAIEVRDPSAIRLASLSPSANRAPPLA